MKGGDIPVGTHCVVRHLICDSATDGLRLCDNQIGARLQRLLQVFRRVLKRQLKAAMSAGVLFLALAALIDPVRIMLKDMRLDLAPFNQLEFVNGKFR